MPARHGALPRTAVALLLAAASSAARAASLPVGDYGAPGLMQTPSARFGADGDFALGIVHNPPYDRFFFTLAPLPWLEGSFRYTDVTNVAYSPSREFSGDQSYKDRSVDVRIRLIEEGPNLPAVALGFRDLGGTQLFGAQYLVANRRYYGFDFSLGLGWGRLGAGGPIKNPFERDQGEAAEAESRTPGNAGVSRLFTSPEIGIFGGVSWTTPVPGLELLLEYDANDYEAEPFDNDQDVRSPVNVGLRYRFRKQYQLGLSYERGDKVSFNLALLTNFGQGSGFPKVLDPLPTPITAVRAPADVSGTTATPFDLPRRGSPLLSGSLSSLSGTIEVVPLVVPPPGLRDAVEPIGPSLRADATIPISPPVLGTPSAAVEPAREPVTAAQPDAQLLDPVPAAAAGGDTRADGRLALDGSDATSQALRKAFRTQRIALAGYSLSADGRTAELVIGAGPYRDSLKTLGRAARTAAAVLPESVAQLVFAHEVGGVPVFTATVGRKVVQDAALGRASVAEIAQSLRIEPTEERVRPAVSFKSKRPAAGYSINPALRSQIGGPDGFFIGQIFLRIGGYAQLTDGLSLNAEYGLSLYDNFGSLKVESDSALPKVRSDIKQYLREGRNALTRLETNYIRQLAPTFYGRVSAGIFEEMYGGVAGELLWRPDDPRFAVGLNVNRVRQRDFNQRLGFRDYEVTTGNLTGYFEFAKPSVLVKLSAGQYLAGDKGATLDVSREFDNGVRVGVFATKTNVSAEQFGEGSFDKGFYFVIPFDLFLPSSNRSVGSFAFRPLTRDGGQMVRDGRSLYEYTREAVTVRMPQSIDSFLK